MSHSEHFDSPLRSEFADDPDMHEVVESYINDMHDRLHKLERCWRDQSVEEIKSVVSQIKNCSAGSGFPWVGDAARAVESPISEGVTDLNQLQDEFDRLIDLCRRVLL